MTSFLPRRSHNNAIAHEQNTYHLNKLHSLYQNNDLSRHQFCAQLEALGYQITPSTYRLINQPTEISFQDLVQALRNTTSTPSFSVPQIQTRAVPSFEGLERHLYHETSPTESQTDTTKNLMQEESARRGSYFQAVQTRTEGGAEKKVMQELRKMLVARHAMDKTVEFLAQSPARGMSVDVMVRFLRTVGVFLEYGEIKTIQTRFPSKARLQNCIDGQQIGQILANTIVDAPDKGFSHTYVPSQNIPDYRPPVSNRNLSYSSGFESNNPSDQASILSSLTNGTANHVPGHMATKQTFSKVQDEYILVRILKNVCVDDTVHNLRRLRTVLIQAGQNKSIPNQQPQNYSSEVTGMVNFYSFKQIIKSFVPSLPESDIMAVFDNLYPDNTNHINSNTFYHRLRGNMSIEHVETMDAVFQGLLMKCPQHISSKDEVSLDILFDNYCPGQEPEVVNGHTDVQTKISELLELHQFSTQQGTVTRKAFFDYFGDLSACLSHSNRQNFVNTINLPWYKVLELNNAQYPSQRRPPGFHRAVQSHLSGKDVPTKVRRVLQRIIRDASWSDQSLQDLYNQFDEDGDGSVSSTEFCKFFSALHIRITADEMDQVMNVLDQNGDGIISFDEFIAVVHASQYLERKTGYMGVAARPKEGNVGSTASMAVRVNVTNDALLSISNQINDIRAQLKSSDQHFGIKGYGQLLIGYNDVTSSASPWITRGQFESILHSAQIRLSKHVAYEVFQVFRVRHAYQDLIHFWQFLNSISHTWNDRRRRITHRAFQTLDANGDGQITVQEMASGFDAKKHPNVLYSNADPNKLSNSFYNLLESAGTPNSPLNAKQWIRLLRYTMSACEQSDDRYEEIMQAVWGM